MELETATKNTLGAARSNAKTFVKAVALLVIVLSTFALSPATPSRTQLDPIGGYEILQKGIKVGEIYVPKRDLGAIKYCRALGAIWQLRVSRQKCRSADDNQNRTKQL